MKFTLAWLKDHLETTASLDDILYALTDLGLEVEGVSNPADRLKDFTIGKVLSAENHGLNTLEMDAAISACSEGYSFPTNLDTDPPIDGLAPETQAALFRRALSIGMTITEFNASLDAQVVRQKF